MAIIPTTELMTSPSIRIQIHAMTPAKATAAPTHLVLPEVVTTKITPSNSAMTATNDRAMMTGCWITPISPITTVAVALPSAPSAISRRPDGGQTIKASGCSCVGVPHVPVDPSSSPSLVWSLAER